VTTVIPPSDIKFVSSCLVDEMHREYENVVYMFDLKIMERRDRLEKTRYKSG
jgi:hypothetical protein